MLHFPKEANLAYKHRTRTPTSTHASMHTWMSFELGGANVVPCSFTSRWAEVSGNPAECVRMYQIRGPFSPWTSEPRGCVFNFHSPTTSALGSRASRKSYIQPSIHRTWSSPGQTNASFYLCLSQCLSVDGEVRTMNHPLLVAQWLFVITSGSPGLALSICNYCNMYTYQYM